MFHLFTLPRSRPVVHHFRDIIKMYHNASEQIEPAIGSPYYLGQILYDYKCRSSPIHSTPVVGLSDIPTSHPFPPLTNKLLLRLHSLFLFLFSFALSYFPIFTFASFYLFTFFIYSFPSRGLSKPCGLTTHRVDGLLCLFTVLLPLSCQVMYM